MPERRRPVNDTKLIRVGVRLVCILAIFLIPIVIQASPLSLSIVVPRPIYPLGSTVFVYARVTMYGSPYPGATVLWELRDPAGVRKDFGQAVTNATGYATIPIFTSPAWPPGAYTLLAVISGTDIRANATISLYPLSAHIIAPMNYSLGSTVFVYARVTMYGSPYPGATVLWELRDPAGVRKDFGQAVTNATGYATIVIQSSKEWMPGRYNITAVVSGTEAKTTATLYLKRAISRLVASVTPPATWRGNDVIVRGYVRLDPAPLAYTGSLKVYINADLIWTLTLKPDGTFISPSLNTSVLSSGVHLVKVELLETPESFCGVNTTTFLIDRVLVTDFDVPSPNRVNANSTQTVKFKLRYESDNSIFSDVSGNRVWINNTLAVYRDGWWSITYRANLGNFSFCVTRVSDQLRTKSERFWVLVARPSIVWDAIILANWTITDPDARVNVNSTQSVYFFAVHWYDGKSLDGVITLNGTFTGRKWVANKGVEINVTHTSVARVRYVPTFVRDNVYGLSAFVVRYIQPPRLTWDIVVVNASRVSKSRVDVGSTQWVEYQLLHAYDREPVTSGNVAILGKHASYQGGGWWRVTVSSDITTRVEASITSVSSQYGITVFKYEIPKAAIIFDRVIFEVSAPARVNVGTAVGDKLRVRGFYEYDQAPFEGTYVVLPSPHEVVDKVAPISYAVARMNETKYGLTRFYSTTAVVRYDRMVVAKYSVNNNVRLLEFLLNYESDRAPVVAEVNIVTDKGEILATLTSTYEGVGRFNYTLFLAKLAQAKSVAIRPVRSLVHEVTVGVGVEVPVKPLVDVLKIDPRCQTGFVVKAEPIFEDRKLAKATVWLDIDFLEKRILRLPTGGESSLVLKPGINTVTITGLLIEDTDVIVPNIQEFIGYKEAYNVALKMTLEIPSYQFTGYYGAMLTGVVNLFNLGNVTLCDVHVVVTLEREGLGKEGRTKVVSLPPGGSYNISLLTLRMGVAFDVGVFKVTALAYYEPGLNTLAYYTTTITFVKELPPELEQLAKERDLFIDQMKEWDRKFFIATVDELIKLYNEKGIFDRSHVEDLMKRLRLAKHLVTYSDDIQRRLSVLNKTYGACRDFLGLKLLGDELQDVLNIWRELKHEEAYRRMILLYRAVDLVYERAQELARVCGLLDGLPDVHRNYVVELLAQAIRLQLQNQTDLAKRGIDEAIRTAEKMSNAWLELRSAEDAIRRAEREARTWGLDKAKALFDEAKVLFEQKKYDEARIKAIEAREAAERALSPWTFILPIVVAIAAGAIASYMILRALRIRRALRS